MSDYYVYTSKGYMPVDPAADSPPSRCEGPSYTGAHGCGRFLRAGAWMCDRCEDETRAHWKDEDTRRREDDAQAAADLNAKWEAYWASAAGQAQLAEEAQARSETEPFAQDDDEDLPF
jgi:hypothetical protein